jgi:sugar O-acyltransferase (sialic acid O-acetyltransferase NeuD family)
MKKKLVIFGADIMAKMVHFYFSRDSDYEVVAFTVDQEYIKEDIFLGLPVLPFENIERDFPPEKFKMFIAIGPSKMNVNREEKYISAKEKGYHLANYISPNSICNSVINENVFIGDFAIINPFCTIGNNNIFYEHTFIGNDVIIGEHCYFAPKAAIGTFAHIKNNSVIGTCAVVNTNVVVAKKTLVGASCFISIDTKTLGVYGAKSATLYGCISDKLNIS